MVKENTQPDTGLNTLIEIQINGTLIGVIDRDQQKTNVFSWRGWLIEIQCQRIDHEWTPFSTTYHAHTPEYEKTLIEQLTSSQRIRLTTVRKARGLN